MPKELPVIMQVEASDCAFACIAMIAGYYGSRPNMAVLRQLGATNSVSTNLTTVAETAVRLGFGYRAVRVNLAALSELGLPCTLHWDLNHFVVLKKVSTRYIEIHDPAYGYRRLQMNEVSRLFTGVALELFPNQNFVRENAQRELTITELFGPVKGVAVNIAYLTLLALTLEGIAIVAPLFLQLILDDVVIAADVDLLITAAVGFCLLLLFQNAILVARAFAILHFSSALNIQWLRNVFEHLTKLPLAYFERRHVGDVVSRFSSIDVIQRTVSGNFVEAMVDGLFSVITLAILFIYSPFLASIAVLTSIFYIIAKYIFLPKLKMTSEQQLRVAAKQSTFFLETIRGIRSIK